MEPRIIKGHQYRCKKSVIDQNKKVYYLKGGVYRCDVEFHYPLPDSEMARFSCGFITNEFGNDGHAWPYDPEHHPLCSDKWTDYFEDLG